MKAAQSFEFNTFFFFLISKENFIQIHKMESPNYIGSIQQGTKTIKYTSYKHPSNHTKKIEWLPMIEIQHYGFFFFF